LTPNWTLAQAVAPAVTGGANLVVLRETDLPNGPRLTVARFVKEGVQGRVPYLLAGAPRLAVEVGADGAHLEDDTASVAEARAILGPERLLGIHVLTIEDALLAEEEGANYLFIEGDWTDGPSVLPRLRKIRKATSLPILIGTDVPLERVAACMMAGASGVAVCSPAMAGYNRTEAMRAYVEALGVE
jgi:thiamine-phosphate pyrophosphorylase